MSRTPDVDIIVVGAGLVGLPLSRCLAQQGWSVALLDEQPGRVDNAENTPMNQRCTAINAGTRRWLEEQSLWHLVESDACAIRQVSVSQKGYYGSVLLNAEDMRLNALGYVINNQMFSGALALGLDQSGVRHITEARVSAVVSEEQSVTVTFAGASLTSRLLIAADGASSVVRDSLGIATRQTDYEQSGVLGTVRVEQEHQHTAYERFTDSGPLALLPRPGRVMSVVECINPEDADPIRQMSDATYLTRLQKRFGFRLGRMIEAGPRFITPLTRIESLQQVAGRTLFLGNAMRLLHPVGGQGFNLAIRDIAALLKILDSCRNSCAQDKSPPDPGSEALLQAYVAARVPDQRRIVGLTDLLARGFRGRARVPSHIRSLGLIGLDTLTPLKRQFAGLTTGVF